MKKILILYFSGVGATKRIAEIIYTQLLRNLEVDPPSKIDIFSIEKLKNEINLENYDALIVGTPTYHAAPSKVVMSYFDSVPQLAEKMPAFIYNTRGLCSLNTNRILAKQLHKKNILTIMDRAYRSPASDGSIIAPFVKRFFEFEKNIDEKISIDCAFFLELLELPEKNITQSHIPRFKFGSIINAPNKLVGQLITIKIHLHKSKCIKCGQCIETCPHAALSRDKDNYPLFIPKSCENCYRCIHHCKSMALSLSKRKTLKTSLRYSDYLNDGS